MGELFKTDRIPVIGPDYDSQQYGVKNVDAKIQQVTQGGMKGLVIRTIPETAIRSADNFYNEQGSQKSVISTSVKR